MREPLELEPDRATGGRMISSAGKIEGNSLLSINSSNGDPGHGLRRSMSLAEVSTREMRVGE